MKKLAFALFLVLGLGLTSAYVTGCPAPVQNEKAAEQAAEQTGDAATGE